MSLRNGGAALSLFRNSIDAYTPACCRQTLASPSPIRILQVTDSLDIGGGERHVVDLATALWRRGYDITVASSTGGALAPELEEAGVPTLRLVDRLVKRRVSLAYAWRLRRLVSRGGYDLVHSHMYASNVAAALATLGTGVPLVVTDHSEGTWRGPLARLVSRLVYRRARHVIAVSKPIQRRLVGGYRMPLERTTIISGAITTAPECDPARLPPLPAELRDRPLVGVVARLLPEKGVGNFLEAVARVAPHCPEVGFLVVGDGPLREELLARRKTLGIEKSVHFLGYRLDAREIISCLQLLVVPSSSEGSPLVIFEAMSAGVPVVATSVGGIPDQVANGQTGLLVPPNDPVALGDALLELLQSPRKARRMGAAGRERLDGSMAGHETMVQRTEAVLLQALGIPIPRPEPRLTT